MAEQATKGNGKTKPKLDDRFKTTVQGRDFVLYEGLLDLAHQQGLDRLEVETLQYPTDDNNREAICRATATANGKTFTDIGDANPKNVNRMIASHIIRMASTRAKARCLRDLTNIGLTALEEIGDPEEVAAGSTNGNGKARKKTSTNGNGRAKSKGNGKKQTGSDPVMSEAQNRAIQNLADRRGLSGEDLAALTADQFEVDPSDLTSGQAATLIKYLQKSN